MSGDARLVVILRRAEAALRSVGAEDIAIEIGIRALAEADRVRTWPFQIDELREAGSEYNGLIGYWCKGHVLRSEFADAANDFSGATETDGFYDPRHVRAGDAVHVWWRNVPIPGDPGCWTYREAEPGSRGAYQVTVANVVERQRTRLAHTRINENSRAHAVGFAAGMAWAAQIAGRRDRTTSDAILEAFSTGASDTAQRESSP